MTHPNMNSGLPVPMARVVDQTYFRASRSTASAANDDAPRKWYEIRNPLWVIVIGMAVLFTVMALTVALG
jgi:hypothetical protein